MLFESEMSKSQGVVKRKWLAFEQGIGPRNKCLPVMSLCPTAYAALVYVKEDDKDFEMVGESGVDLSYTWKGA